VVKIYRAFDDVNTEIMLNKWANSPMKLMNINQKYLN